MACHRTLNVRSGDCDTASKSTSHAEDFFSRSPDPTLAATRSHGRISFLSGGGAGEASSIIYRSDSTRMAENKHGVHPSYLEQRDCLYCLAPAVSLEHFFPAGLGGTRKIPILCEYHNCKVADLCDKPLVESMAFFVHAFRIRRGSGEHGIAMQGTGPDGKPIVIDSDLRPQAPKIEILERGLDNRPAKVAGRTIEAVEKLLKSMGIDPSTVTFEERFEPSPAVKFDLHMGGPGAFRGILMIAYEFVRGYLNVPSTDREAEALIHAALLHGADPMPFVRWLPYEMLPGGDEVGVFSSRIATWFDGTETVVIVELFNCLPFVIRLPGIAVPGPELYIQSVHGGDPMTGTMMRPPFYTFADVPEHAQHQILAEFTKRFEPILQVLRISMFIRPIAAAMGECFQADPTVGESEMDAFVLARVAEHTGRDPVEAERLAVKELVGGLLPLLRATPPTAGDWLGILLPSQSRLSAHNRDFSR